MPNSTSRLLSIILLMQSQRTITLSQIAKEFSVSIRTAQRYMNALQETGIPVTSQQGRGGGYSLVRGYKLPPLLFTPDEAAALYLGAKLVKEIGLSDDDPIIGAISKLGNVLPDTLYNQAERASSCLIFGDFELYQPSFLRHILSTFQHAVINQNQIEIYTQWLGEPELQIIEPLYLIYEYGSWYYTAKNFHTGQIVTTSIRTVVSARKLDETFEWPAGFDIRTHYQIGRFSVSKGVEVVIGVSKKVAEYVRRGRYSWQQITTNEDGSLTMRFRTKDLRHIGWIIEWLSNYHGEAWIIEPDELKKRVQMIAQLILKPLDLRSPEEHDMNRYLLNKELENEGDDR